MPAWKPLLKTGFGYHRSHPLQSLLIVIGIALGVAVIVAIDIANSSVSRSFKLSTESLTGKTTHQIIGSQAGFSQAVFRDLRVKLGHRRNAPIIEGYVQVKDLDLQTIKLLGVDPFSEIGFRNLLGDGTGVVSPDTFTGLLAEPGRIMISEQLSAKIDIISGDYLTVSLGGNEKQLEVYGLLKSRNDMTRSVLSGVIITDIATAQEILNTGDQISRIDLIVDEPNKAEILAAISNSLPAGVQIVPASARSASIRKMSRAFELNLTAMSLLALLVGMFLIYNTITFSVVQRRKLLGILRALGTTRSEIFLMVISETMILGVTGSCLGLFLGILLGVGTVKLVGQTISDLYFMLSVTAFSVSPLLLAKALGMGLLASFISALFPAIEAIRVPPVVAQRRSSLESYATTVLPTLTSIGFILLIAGSSIMTVQSRMLEFSFGGLFLIVFGSALLVPFLSRTLLAVILKIPGVASSLIIRLAIRNVSRSLSRTAVAIAALMIAVSVIVGVGIMVESFRYTVLTWLKHTIVADVYMVGINRDAPSLHPEIPKIIREIPGVREVYPVRSFKINTGEYRGVTVFVIEKEMIQRQWIWKPAGEKTVNRQFESGSVFISENFAWNNKMSMQAGEKIVLETNRGNRAFPVAGVFRDFSSRQGMIVLHRDVYRKHWQDRRISGIGMITDPSVSAESVIDRVNERIAGRHQYIITSNAAIRTSAINVFERTFTITVALQILAALVAFIGVFNSIMSMMLERTREIGIIRANGMTRGQLWQLILGESGIIGVLAGVLAFPLGTAMAWILVHIINKRSFGWTLDFVVEPYHYLQAIGIAVIASVAAGIYPSLRIAGKEIIEALRNE